MPTWRLTNVWFKQPEWVEEEETKPPLHSVPISLGLWPHPCLPADLFFPSQREPNLCLDQGPFRNGRRRLTEQGSRLRTAPRLSEGLVTLLFDSGQRSLKTRSLKLIDSMQCELINGTAAHAPNRPLVSDHHPRSRRGGLRSLAVTVFEETEKPA